MFTQRDAIEIVRRLGIDYTIAPQDWAFPGDLAVKQELICKNGDTSTGSRDVVQQKFGYNGTSEYPHFIITRHNTSAALNAFEFYTCDGTKAGVFPTNAVLGLTIENGVIKIPSLTSELLKVDGSGVVAEAVEGTDYAGVDFANVFTAVQKINVNSATAFLVEQDGVKDNVLLVDTATPTVTTNAPTLLADDTSGDVELFKTGTVANATDGKSLIIHRKAAEFNRRFKFYINEGGLAYIDAPDGPAAFTTASSFNFYSPITRFGRSWSPHNDVSDFYGYVTAAAASKYARFQLASTGVFTLSPQDTNVTKFLVSMDIDTSEFYAVSGTQVVGARGAHVADADGTLASVTAQFNTLLTRLETHGLLASV